MAIKGIKAIKERAEKAKGFSGDGESPFFSLKDGESAKVRFLQELDDESEYYDERRGTVLVVEEHNAPQDFKRTALCTAESEGRCWACEQTSDPKVGKKWKPKLRFYANVLVRNPEGEDKVKILKRGFSDKDIGNDVVNVVEEFEAISDKDVKISRKGAGMNDTSYSLLPLAPKPMSEAESKLELIDPTKFVKHVAYEDQPAFYAGQESEGGKASEWLDD